MQLLDKHGRLTPYAFACGYVEKVGEHITISKEHGVYHIKRHPAHAGGWKWESTRQLGEARRIAKMMQKKNW